MDVGRLDEECWFLCVLVGHHGVSRRYALSTTSGLRLVLQEELWLLTIQ